MCVSDAVEAPVLTVNSNWFSGDSCTVNFTCRAHELTINSSYQNNRCSPEEVTSQINTLILDCSEKSIICNHSNPVSWKQDRRNITQLCDDNKSICPHTHTIHINSQIKSLFLVYTLQAAFSEDLYSLTDFYSSSCYFPENERSSQTTHALSYMIVLIVVCVVGVIVFAALVIFCCCEKKTGLSISNLLN